MDNSSGVPAWLKKICNAEFFEPCKTHMEEKKNDLNFFCIDCLFAMCSHCLPCHLEHQSIQIRRYMYQHVINVQDLRKFFSCSGIQTYLTNGAKVAYIRKRADSQQLSSATSYHCVNCERNLLDPSALYCSIQCKVTHIYGNKTLLKVDDNDEKEENTASSKTNKRPKSRKRKGLPIRAPLF